MRYRYTYKLLFPNKEVRDAIELVLLKVVAGGLDRASMYWQGMEALMKGDVQQFTSFLQTYVQQVPSYFDTSKRAQEPYYHGLLLGMVTCLWDVYHITSNRESGAGRYDISLLPKDVATHPGVLIEVKIAQEGDDLATLAAAAREQILAKGYGTEMKAKGVDNILHLGVAFGGKAVEVAT